MSIIMLEDNILKKIIAIILPLAFIFAGCGVSAAAADDSRVRVVATIFAPYDFTRQIAGDSADITMLLQPGGDVKSFEPTPQDILRIQNSDIFIHGGGEFWVESILSSIDTSDMIIVRMMDYAELLREEIVPGMDFNPPAAPVNFNPNWCVVCDEQPTRFYKNVYDEHVWTSPTNAILIAQGITDALVRADPNNSRLYEQNATDFIAQLEQLDAAFREVVEFRTRDTIVFGDRFPFRYFVHAYGLEYYAALPGCSSTTEPSAATVAFLINKIIDEDIPIVFHAEMSNQRLANTIAEATGANVRLLHAAHNVSRDEFRAGVTYIDLMTQNVETLREALW